MAVLEISNVVSNNGILLDLCSHKGKAINVGSFVIFYNCVKIGLNMYV